jgi:hypothetical protein
MERARQHGIQTSTEDHGVVALHGVDETNVGRVWEWARDSGVGVRSLTPARNTLEQVFMDAIRDSGSPQEFLE